MMSTHRKPALAVLLGAALSAAASLCAIQAASAQSLAGREVAIGAIVPSSGPFAEWGRTNTVALRML